MDSIGFKRNTAFPKTVPRLTRHIILGIFIAAGIFILDMFLPLGVADGVLYVALVLLGLWARNRHYILWGAIAGTFLTFLGFYLSPEGGELWKVVVNRFLAVIAIWMTATLCFWQYRANKKLQQAHDKLEERVKERTAQLKKVNEQLQRETQFVELHKDIAVASNETRAIEDAMVYCLKRICAHTGWPVGHLYLSSESSPHRLEPTPIWYLEYPERFATFREITEATPFDPGVGLPGRVLADQKPAWIIDVTQDPNFPRAKLAKNIGVKAGFAFPILIGKEIVGVMEFFSAQAAEPDSEMLEIMAQVGTQLGRVIERKRAEEYQEKLLGSLRERVKELTALYGVANLVSTSGTLKEVLEKLESYIVPGMQFPELTRVRVSYEGETFGSKVFEETPWKLSGKIMVDGARRGTLEVTYRQPRPAADEGPFLKEERYMIEGLARLLSVTAERKRAEEEIQQHRFQLRNLYHRLELVREEERTRIAREVHDELAQVLTAMKLELTLLQKKLVDKSPEVRKRAVTMLELVDNTIQWVKKIALDLRPPVLDDLGLVEAIEWQGKEFEKRTGIQCIFNIKDENLALDKARSTTVFRIFQETLTNVIRHAQATQVYVTMSGLDDIFTLKVQDNGKGITPGEISSLRSLGILGMRERALVWGGRVDIQGVPGKGTSVLIKIKTNGQ